MRNCCKSLVFFMMIFVFPGVSYANLTDGLVAYFPLDGNANDESGYGNDGTVSGATLTSAMASSNDSAYEFDGNDHITVHSPSSVLNIGNQSWSISAWVQTTGNTITQQIVGRYECGWGCSMLNIYGHASAVYYLTIASNGIPSLYLRDNNGSQTNISSPQTPVNDGKWHHIVAILDRVNQSTMLFVDGEIASTLAADQLGSIDDEGSPLSIGYNFKQIWAQPTNYFNGKIDNIRMYNRVLSECEISELYRKFIRFPGFLL